MLGDRVVTVQHFEEGGVAAFAVLLGVDGLLFLMFVMSLKVIVFSSGWK